MTRNSTTKIKKNLRSTGSRQEAVTSVLRKEKRVYGGNDLKKMIGFKPGVKERDMDDEREDGTQVVEMTKVQC